MFTTRQLLLPLYCYSANPVWILQTRNEADLQVARMFSHADRGCVKSHIHRDDFLKHSIGDPLTIHIRNSISRMLRSISYSATSFSFLSHLNMKRLVSSTSNTLQNKNHAHRGLLTPCGMAEVYWRFRECWLPGLLFDPEHGRSLFLRNVNKLQPDWAVSHSRRWHSPQSLSLSTSTSQTHTI
jgi:hypothetical protein